MSPTYYVELLGQPKIQASEGRTVSVSRKQLGLVANVYAKGQQRVGRDAPAGLLWPNTSRSSARHSLSQALYVLKRECPGLLVAEPEYIAAGDGKCDVVAFRNAIDIGDWTEAGRLYRGAFLRGFTIPDSPEFSHWTDGIREELTSQAETVSARLFESFEWTTLERLSAILVEQGRLSESLVNARTAALLHTDGWRSAVRFARNLPSSFSAAAQAVLDQTDEDDTPPAARNRHLFVGRVVQMRRLADLYERCLEDRPSIALITGEAGIGKTALANRFYRLLAIRGAQVLMASAHSAEHNVPLGVVDQWLRDISERDLKRVDGQPWMTVIRHAFPGLNDGQVAESPAAIVSNGHQRLLESIRRLLIELAGDRPLVLGIDDLHHADPTSVGLLHYLFRRNPVGPALVVATGRTEVAPDFARIDSWDAVQKIQVDGLTTNEIEDWLARLEIPGRRHRAVARSLHERTAGNPLLISALIEEGATGESQTPQSVVDFYRPRILARSQEARTLLATISLVGEPRPWQVLAKIADLSSKDCTAACRELEELNWVNVEGELVELRHSLLGQAAISLLSAVEKTALYGRAARVMSKGGERPHAVVAVSYDLAGNQTDAFEAALRAIDACETLHARSEKEFFLKLGLSNAPTLSDAAQIRIRLAEHLLGERRSREALESVDPVHFSGLSEDYRLRAELVRIQIEAEMATHYDELAALWKRAKTIRGQLGSLTLADTYSLLAGITHDLGYDQLSLEIAEEIVDQVSGLPLTILSARKLLRPIVIIGMSRGFSGALDRFSTLPDPAKGDPQYACAFHARRASVLVAAGRLLDAEADFANAFGLAERYALFDFYFFIHNNLGVCLLEQGRFAEAERHFLAAAEFVDSEITPGHHWVVEDNLMILEFERGDFVRALEMAEASRPKRLGSGVRAGMSLHCIIGLCSLEQGRLARSKEAEREIKLMAQIHEPTGNDMSYVNVFLARMLDVRGDPGQAVALLAEAASWYESRNALAFARIQLERCRLAFRAGAPDKAALASVRKLLLGSGATPLIDRAESLAARA